LNDYDGRENIMKAVVSRGPHKSRDLVIAGKASPSLIISHHLPIEAAPDACDEFDKRMDGYTKAILKPEMRV
jgi:glutathione-independent formaldehyde dehydrogenase